MSESLLPHGLYSPWNSPGQNTGVGSLSLLQGIFPTQGSNPGLQHYRKQGKVGLKLGFLSGPLMVYLKVLSLSLFSMGDGEQFNSQGICLRDQSEKIKMHFKINSFQCCSGRGAHWDLYKQLIFCFNISAGCWWCGWSLWRARGFLKTSCFAYTPCQSKSKSWMRFWP